MKVGTRAGLTARRDGEVARKIKNFQFLDFSATSPNILGAQAELSKQQAELTGKQFGSDGWEITYHSGHRPTHDFGGKQFTKQEFDSQGIDELMSEPNCYHRKFPIIVGVSQPAYTAAQLAEFEASENAVHTFNGKEYTRYEAAQRQRQYETAIRQKKDEANAYDALAKGHIAELPEKSTNQRFGIFRGSSAGGGSESDALYKQYKETSMLARAKANAINGEYARKIRNL